MSLGPARRRGLCRQLVQRRRLHHVRDLWQRAVAEQADAQLAQWVETLVRLALTPGAGLHFGMRPNPELREQQRRCV
jgi:hypothetical protein